MSILRDAIDKIVELAAPTVIEVDGKTYAKEKFKEVKEAVYYPDCVYFSELSGLVKMIQEEAVNTYDGKIYIRVHQYNAVDVFTSLDEYKTRSVIYKASADVPGFREGYKEQEEMIIQLRSLFLQTPDVVYLLDLLSRMTDTEKATTRDNGVTQIVEAKKGISLKEAVEVRPRVKLTPFRTFLEVEQPESEFLLRINPSGDIGLFEADGSVWKLVAKRTIKQYLENALKDLIESGRVVVTM